MHHLATKMIVALQYAICGLSWSSKATQAPTRSEDLRGFIPESDITTSGCRCLTQCGASLAQRHRCDWCRIDKDSCPGRGRWSITRGHYDFCSFNADEDYQSLSASAKLDKLWSRVVADPRTGSQRNKFWVGKQVLTLSMITTFDNVGDVMPAGREKVIHLQGVVLKFKFSVVGNSPYTGMLEPGTHEGLMRLGSAFPTKDATFPGIAVKFLRSGIHSANTVALRQTGHKSGQTNFFEVPLTTHVKPPGTVEALHKFTQASGCRSMTGISDWCSYSQDGKQASKLNFPYELQFEAPDPLMFAVNRNATVPDEELISKLASIQAGTHLYSVNAKASPGASWVHVGDIVTTTKATRSMFGDTLLSFRHQRMEEDFAKRPEWLSQIDQPNCDQSVDRKGNLRPLSDWKCPGVVGIPPVHAEALLPKEAAAGEEL